MPGTLGTPTDASSIREDLHWMCAREHLEEILILYSIRIGVVLTPYMNYGLKI